MTINEKTDCLAAVRHAIMGGKFLLRLTEDRGVGHRYANVLDDQGNVIGSASDYIYGGRGWAVHTAPYAGFVEENQVVLV